MTETVQQPTKRKWAPGKPRASKLAYITVRASLLPALNEAADKAGVSRSTFLTDLLVERLAKPTA